jgi:hypothetical protein
MSNFEKLKKSVDELLEVMSLQDNDVNLYILKIIFEQYAFKKNIDPIQVSKDLVNEFLNNEIDNKYSGKKVVIKEEKINKEEKLYTNTKEVVETYFKRLIFSDFKKDNKTDYFFYESINREILSLFIASHKRNLPHRYAPQQTKI